MRHVAFTALKKLKNTEVFVNLFEEWPGEKMLDIEKNQIPHTVNNNTISVRSVNALVSK